VNHTKLTFIGMNPNRSAVLYCGGPVLSVQFFVNDWPAAQRDFDTASSQAYAVCAAENWCDDILNLEHFTLEERLRA